MAMKNAAKKSRRRLKRSVRRSLAAVLMITAIGVAAIPVPENYAAPEGGVGTRAATVNYYYPGSEADPDGNKLETVDMEYDIGLGVGSAKKYDSHTIRQMSDGTWQAEWQFEFFQQKVNGVMRGIISKYNNTYQENEVKLKANVVMEYAWVDVDVYEDYYESQKTKEYLFDKGNSTGNNAVKAEAFFKEYFTDAYNQYIKEYQAYETAYNQWISNPNHTGDAPQPPAALTREVNDLTGEQKLKYYCDQMGYEGCTLVSVTDMRKPDSTNPDPGGDAQNSIVYVPRKIEGATLPEGYSSDDNSFVYENGQTSSIVGIGNEAFKGTRNVNVLDVPEEIRYIGESAFEDSFIAKISFNNVTKIDNYAFKNCSRLTDITMGATTEVIGTEAFYGTGLAGVQFPSSLKNIGPGAFAFCGSLQSLDFSGVTDQSADGIRIGDYAFYNDVGLNSVNFTRGGATTSVNIKTVGEAAFAVESGITGSMTTFAFPSAIARTKTSKDTNTLTGANSVGLGNLVLAGRTNLTTVTMPADYGRSTEVDVPNDLLYNCVGLESVVFPDDGNRSCGLATYDSEELFKSVTNPDFYVRGPELDRSSQPASPRISTWDAVSAVSDKIPYVYVKNGKEYYEISDGFYLLCIDNTGMLTSCVIKPNKDGTSGDISKWDGELEIPAKVGNTKVVGIASGCFSDPKLNTAAKSLVITDNSITTIEDGVFQASESEDDRQWKNLEKVYIGNSVNSIGNNAFKNCSSLVDVTFNTPSAGYEGFTIGTDAFKTESGELMFHGDIVEGYAPFDWAMDPGNIIQQQDRIRVCYKSLSPTYLTVMYNPITEKVTLLDYPKYSQVSEILNEKYGFGAGSDGYEDMMVANWYAMYAGADYDSYRTIFADAWSAAQAETDEETRKELCEQLYTGDTYGPWINEEFCLNWNKWVGGSNPNPDPGPDPNPSDGTTQTKNSLTDWLFEPIVVQAAAAGPDAPLAYYERNAYDIIDNVNSGDPYRFSEEERQLVNATKNIVVPAGVDSIDVYGYINNLTEDGERAQGENSGANTGNYNTYFNLNWPSETRNMYNGFKSDADDLTDTVPGLFSGYYKDYKSGSDVEKFVRGNDLIESVTLNSVTYLPDYAFDSCENLQWVIIGDALADIGKAPFRGCYKMTSVSNNEYYTTENGIIYSNNTDGSRTIEECLSARGNGVGEGIVSLSSDPALATVSAIKPGAFEDCDNITSISFGMNDTAGLAVIPEDCFRNCDRLASVVLPRTVNDVGKGAFVGSNALNTLTFYGKEVKISGSAFENTPENPKGNTLVRTYEDSAVVRYVNEYGKEYNLTLDNNRLGELWSVTFLDADHMMLGELVDKEGNEIENPQYVEDGAYARIPTDPVHDGWTFERWVGMNNAAIDEKITQDTIFYAQGYSNDGMVNGKYMVEFYDGVDGKKIGPTQYISPGGEAIAPAPPAHDGYTFDKWSDSFTGIQSNKSIVALYKSAGGSGGSTNTSGGSTNTSGNSSGNRNPSNNTTNTSSGNSTSSQTSSSTSTTSSSTASTSTTSAESKTTLYSVVVIGGSGSGSYAPGTPIVITANTGAEGSTFSKWTTDSPGVSLANVSQTPTSFTMPPNNVTITAEYTTGTPAGTPAGGGSSTGGSGGNQNSSTGNTRVDITKPGISNKDLATANVNGATDNFVIKISETDEATRAVADALTNEYTSLDNILYYAMDISLYDSTGTVKITDTSGISVDITIPIPDALVAYGGNNMAGAVVNGNQLENLNENFTTINGVPCIRFTASHFSPYTIYVDTGNLTEGLLDTTPKTGDPIHPKWFLSIGLACLSIILFMKRDKRVKVKTA